MLDNLGKEAEGDDELLINEEEEVDDEDDQNSIDGVPACEIENVVNPRKRKGSMEYLEKEAELLGTLACTGLMLRKLLKHIATH